MNKKIRGIAIPPINVQGLPDGPMPLEELQLRMHGQANCSTLLTCYNCLYDVQNFRIFEKVFNKYWSK